MEPTVWFCWLTHCSWWISITTPLLRSAFGKQPLMTQACSVPFSSRPPPCYFFSLSWLFLSSFLFYFFFLLLKYLAVLLTVRFPPHIGSAGLFCPQNAAEICSSPNQMAAFTERSVTPVPHHMTFASLGAITVKGPLPPPFVHAKTRAPLLGGSTSMASQVPKEKLIFIFSHSNSCLVRVF